MAKSEYIEYWTEAEQYLKAVKGGLRRPEVFTPEIMYNLLGISIEKYFMAAMVSNGDMADNHTFTDLINSAKRVYPVDDTLAARLYEAEGYQNLCPAFDGYMRKDIPREAILSMITLADDVTDWASKAIGQAS